MDTTPSLGCIMPCHLLRKNRALLNHIFQYLRIKKHNLKYITLLSAPSLFNILPLAVQATTENTNINHATHWSRSGAINPNSWTRISDKTTLCDNNKHQPLINIQNKKPTDPHLLRFQSPLPQRELRWCSITGF